MRIERMEGVNMTRNHNHIGAAAGTVLVALALAACASTGATSAASAKSAENQKKQAELQQKEAFGQRNDIDPPLIEDCLIARQFLLTRAGLKNRRRRSRRETRQARHAAQISATWRWSVPQHPPSTLSRGSAVRKRR